MVIPQTGLVTYSRNLKFPDRLQIHKITSPLLMRFRSDWRVLINHIKFYHAVFWAVGQGR